MSHVDGGEETRDLKLSHTYQFIDCKSGESGVDNCCTDEIKCSLRNKRMVSMLLTLFQSGLSSTFSDSVREISKVRKVLIVNHCT